MASASLESKGGVVNAGDVEHWERWLRDEEGIQIAGDLASAESVRIKYTRDGDAEKNLESVLERTACPQRNIGPL